MVEVYPKSLNMAELWLSLYIQIVSERWELQLYKALTSYISNINMLYMYNDQ